jgi:hypothetical protein
MARTYTAAQTLAGAGARPTFTAPDALGDIVDIGPGRVLSVINGSGGSINVTIQTPGTVDGDLAVPERVVAVTASTTPFLIPLASKNYKRPAGGADAGKAYVDYSAVTSVTRAVISLPLS